MRIALNWPQTQARRALQPGNTVCTPWGRGVGKSWFLRLYWYLLVAQWDGRQRPGATAGLTGVRIVLLMPTFKQCTDVHGALLQAELEGQWKALGGRLNRTRWRVDFPGGSWIQFFGAKEAQSARGLRCDCVTVDEADDVDPEVIDGVVNPWFSEPFSLASRLVSGTPRRGRYGLLYRTHRRGLDGHPHHFSFHATYRDAPETVSAEYVERIRAETPPEVLKREWECDFDAAEGLVYDLFQEAFHVREPDPRTVWSEILIGGDHGYEDPGVLLVAGVAGQGRDATVHLIDEVYKQHQTETWWVAEGRKLKAKYPTAKWYLDPSQPARVEAFRQAGCKVQPVDNSIDDGVSAVADRLVIRKTADGGGTARLFVAPKCRNTISEFGLYRRRRDPRNRERVLDDIEDRHNHAMDALRYAVFSRFGKPASVRVDDGAGW